MANVRNAERLAAQVGLAPYQYGSKPGRRPNETLTCHRLAGNEVAQRHLPVPYALNEPCVVDVDRHPIWIVIRVADLGWVSTCSFLPMRSWLVVRPDG